MAEWSDSRLMVIGPEKQVKAFQKSQWKETLGAKYHDHLEWSQGRYICLFQTNSLRIKELTGLSCKWKKLVFLLDYHLESKRVKGLAKVRNGKVDYCQFHY